MVLLWLAAITAANLIVAKYGPEASIWCAFVLVAVTFVVRDRLHDRWEGRGRWWRMAALIAAGGALAWLACLVGGALEWIPSPDEAGRIGVASCVAFAAAESVDALVYHSLRARAWLERCNASNLVGAAVDSIVFPTIAFGGVLWAVSFGQFTAKVAGGLLFSLLTARAVLARHA